MPGNGGDVVIGDRWGVTDAEVARRYSCDDLVRTPVLQAWRGVSVAAAASEVWPWIAQIRLAPYSYDWIDNLGRGSPQELRNLPEPRAGEPFTTSGTRRLGRILSVTPGEQLTGRIRAPLCHMSSYRTRHRPACCSRLSPAADG